MATTFRELLYHLGKVDGAPTELLYDWPQIEDPFARELYKSMPSF